MHDMAKKAKTLEVNPRSPLIEGLLSRVSQLPGEDEERDFESEDELREVTAVLIDGALVRSGFAVTDSNEFFTRVDRILRRSLGVSETAQAEDTVKPAPPQADKPIEEEELTVDDTHIMLDPEMLDGMFKPHEEPAQEQMQWEVEEIDEEGNVIRQVPVSHDEL